MLLQRSRISRQNVTSVGLVALLRRTKVGLICSLRCAGGPIIKAYDLIQSIRRSDLAVVSGFHSSVEKDCLGILLRGSGSIIICPARRLNPSRLPREWQEAIETGRMLLLSPFDEKQKRTTAELAIKRNQFVASIADEILIVYAHPGSKTETLSREVLASGKRVYTFNDPANANLISMGAVPIEPNHFSNLQEVNT